MRKAENDTTSKTLGSCKCVLQSAKSFFAALVSTAGSFNNDKRRSKVKLGAVVTILQLSHLVRILQCWRSTLQLRWCARY